MLAMLCLGRPTEGKIARQLAIHRRPAWKNQAETSTRKADFQGMTAAPHGQTFTQCVSSSSARTPSRSWSVSDSHWLLVRSDVLPACHPGVGPKETAGPACF